MDRRAIIQNWDTAHGLPQNTVNTMALGPRGFLWVGTFGGLARFDGTSFKTWSTEEGLTFPRVTAMDFDNDGNLWLGCTAGRVTRFDPIEQTFRSEALGPPYRARTIRGLKWKNRTLHLWIDGGRHMARTDDGLWKQLPESEFPVADSRWTRSRSGIHTKGPQPRAVARVETDGRRPIETRDGAVIVTKGHRLIRLDHPERFIGRPAEGRAQLRYSEFPFGIASVLSGTSDELWVGSRGGGLFRVTRARHLRLAAGQEVKNGVKGAIPHPKGGLLVNVTCDGIHHFLGRDRVRPVVPPTCLQAMVYESKRERLFAVGMDGLLSVDLKNEGSPPTWLQPNLGLLTSIAVDKRHQIWVGATSGRVAVERNGTLVDFEAPTTERINIITESNRGEVWVGGHQQVGVWHPNEGWRLLGTKDGVPSGAIRTIAFVGDDTWLGSYGGGIVRLGPRGAFAFDAGHGLPDLFVSHIGLDGQGRMWLNGNRGVFSIPLSDFDDVQAGRRSMLRARHHVSHESENGEPSGYFDGRDYFFPSIDGLVAVNAIAEPTPPTKLRTSIELATLNDAPLSAPQSGRGRLYVEYTAPFFGEPGLVSFQYRLGSGPWTRTRQRKVLFEHIPVGTHRFSVRALNIASDPGPASSLSFQIAPYFWQRPTVHLGLLALLALTALAYHRQRTRRLEEHSKRMSMEVDRRRAVETALTEREQHYRTLFEESANALVLEDEAGHIIDLNPAACGVFRAQREQLIGLPVADLRAMGRASNPDFELFQRADGETFEGTRSLRTLEAEPLRHLHTIVDLEPLVAAQRKEKDLAAQLARSQRMESVGRLASGVAHDVNNMLTVVQGQAQLALESNQSGERDEVEACLADILKSSERTGRVTRQLLALGRRNSSAARELDLAHILREMGTLLDRLVPESARLTWSVPEGPRIVQADRAQLEQVLVNLVINSVQALNDEEGTIAISLDDEGAFVRMAVEDDGRGMAEEVQQRIFEPFFSTKPEGRNTGLGLAVVHATVVELGGRCEVSSAEGVGTRFEILLPRHAGLPAPSLSEGLDTQPIPTQPPRRERVLYCEDEAPVRRTTCRILESAGFEVTAAETPHAAVAAFDAARAPYDLLITDVVMPEMNGKELGVLLRARQPSIPVLYLSGYASNLMDSLSAGESFLPKPYRARSLLDRVEGMLNGTAPPASADAHPLGDG